MTPRKGNPRVFTSHSLRRMVVGLVDKFKARGHGTNMLGGSVKDAAHPKVRAEIEQILSRHLLKNPLLREAELNDVFLKAVYEDREGIRPLMDAYLSRLIFLRRPDNIPAFLERVGETFDSVAHRAERLREAVQEMDLALNDPENFDKHHTDPVLRESALTRDAISQSMAYASIALTAKKCAQAVREIEKDAMRKS